MASKLLAFDVAVLVAASALITLPTLATAMPLKNAYAASDVWYPGINVKKDMWVQYTVQQLDTANNQPFILTLWFKDQDQHGNWIVPAVVQYNGQIINGTLKLAPNMAPLGGGQVPDSMNQFVSGYQNSLQWLDAFSTKSSPLSLSAGSWGRIAAIGGSEIKPSGTEKVTFAGAKDLCGADSCDSTVILWHKGVDNKIWIVNGFPFPVKADTFAEVSSGQPPTLFKFELLATGTGKPSVSTTNQAIKPPVKQSTATGNYFVTLDWQPTEIQAGSTVKFSVSFSDKQGFPLQNVNYDFKVTDANNKDIINLKSQRSAVGGPETQQVKIDNPGSVTVVVTVNSVNGQTTTSGLIDSATFPLVVGPEFPPSILFIVTAAVLSFVVVMARANKRADINDSKFAAGSKNVMP